MFSQGVVTVCGHLFCKGDFGLIKGCSQTWFQLHHKCPFCNQHVEPSQLSSITLQEQLPSNANVTSELVTKLKRTPLEGSYGTKIDLIIRHIFQLRKENAEVKCLIFSQWEQVLDFISIGLKRNGIGHLKLEGTGWSDGKKIKMARSKTVIAFSQDTSISCFMLNAKSQSSGLTLVAATHVFLVEPLLNRGLEMQAIHRVHRIGQTKTSYVWRYLVRGSIEDRINEHSTFQETKFVKGGELASYAQSLRLFEIDGEK